MEATCTCDDYDVRTGISQLVKIRCKSFGFCPIGTHVAVSPVCAHELIASTLPTPHDTRRVLVSSCFGINAHRVDGVAVVRFTAYDDVAKDLTNKRVGRKKGKKEYRNTPARCYMYRLTIAEEYHNVWLRRRSTQNNG